jgi:hypothetical protein
MNTGSLYHKKIGRIIKKWENYKKVGRIIKELGELQVRLRSYGVINTGSLYYKKLGEL